MAHLSRNNLDHIINDNLIKSWSMFNIINWVLENRACGSVSCFGLNPGLNIVNDLRKEICEGVTV